MFAASCSGSREVVDDRASIPAALSHVAAIAAFAPHVHPTERLERVERVERAGGGWRRGRSASASAWRTLGAIDAVLPATATAPLRIGSSNELWIELTAVAARDGATTVSGNAVVHAGAARDTDVVFLAEASRIEEVRLLRTPRSPRSFAYQLALGPEVSSVRVRGDVVEVVDRRGNVALTSEPLFAVDAHGVRAAVIASVEGARLSFTLEERSDLAFPIAIDPAWTTAGTITGRYGHGYGATMFRVLVGGGRGASGLVATAELWEEGTTTWTSIPLKVPREQHTVTACEGQVILAGGSDGTSPLSSVEAFSAGSMTLKRSLTIARSRHSAVYIGCDASAYLLVVGGAGSSGLLASAELGVKLTLDAGNWISAAGLPAARASMAAVALSGNRAFVVGGECAPKLPGVCAEAWIYDLATNTWTAAGAMSAPRMDHAAAVLASGQILVAGGRMSSGGASFTNVDLFDPTTKTWTARKAMTQPRASFLLAEIAPGRVLAAGGATRETEIYDVATNTWVSAGLMASEHREAGGFMHGTTVKTALVVGGLGLAGPISTAEQFALLANGAACTLGGECASTCCTSAGTCGTCADVGPDASGDASDTWAPDTFEPDTSVDDTSVGEAAIDSSTPTDTAASIDSAIADRCTTNDQCSAAQFCDDGRCVPRIERPELGCGCAVVGVPANSVGLVAALMISLALACRGRRSGEAHARRGR